jgi:hypothetical protein
VRVANVTNGRSGLVGLPRQGGLLPDRGSTGSGRAGLARERVVWSAVIERCAGDPKLVAADPDSADRWAAAVSNWMVDASLLADACNLHDALETLRSAHVELSCRPAPETARLDGMITALAETARASLDRARQAQLAETLDPQTVAARMLLMIDAEPGVASAQMKEDLGIDDSQVSRSGRALIERGLAVKDRHGKQRCWRCTPRGTLSAQRIRDRAASQRVATT